MSRAFTRALVLTTIGGLAIAPAIAFAADGDPTPHQQTVTRVHVPKNAEGGEGILLSARVSIAKPPAGPTTDQGPNQQNPHGMSHRRPAETGAVTFVVDGKSLPPVKISHGRAIEKLTLKPGNHTAAASYSGDSNYNASQSAPVTFTVS